MTCIECENVWCTMTMLGELHLTSILKRSKVAFMTTNFGLVHIPLGASMVKHMEKNVMVYKNHNILGQTPKSSSKVLFKMDFSSCWPLLMCWVLKYAISR